MSNNHPLGDPDPDPSLARQPSMQVLDPSPDESPTSSAPTSPSTSQPNSKNESYFPAPTGSSRLGLQTGTHKNTAHYLLLTQRYSSYTFAAFTAAHLANTGIIPLVTRSVDASTPYLLLTRPYYQSWPLAEPLLVIAPLALHIASGIALRIHRRRILLRHYGYYDADAPGDPTSKAGRAALWRRLNTSSDSDVPAPETKAAPWPKLTWTSIAGYAAIPMVLGHSAVNRLLPLLVDGGSSSIGLDFVGHGVSYAPVISSVGFAVFVSVVGSHAVWGGARWMGLAPDDAREGEDGGKVLRRKRRWWGVWGVSALVVGAWLVGGVGVLGRGGRVGGWVGGVYDGIFRWVPWIAPWMD